MRLDLRPLSSRFSRRSIAVVGCSPSGPLVNAAVRLGLGTWSSTVVGSGSAKLTYLSRCPPRAHSSPGLERALANSSKAGDLVLDAFLGSGSTLVACERTGRICAGVELDPVYADVVLARFEPEC